MRLNSNFHHAESQNKTCVARMLSNREEMISRSSSARYIIGQFAFSGATQGADFSLVRPSAAQKLQRICGLDNILLVFIMKDKLHRLQDMEMTGCLFANCRREVRRLPVLRDTVIRHFLVLMAACISLDFSIESHAFEAVLYYR